MHITEEIQPSGSKLVARSVEEIIVGYTKSNQIYRIWIPSKPNQIRESRDIRFAPIPEKSVSFHLELSSNSQSANDQLSTEISALPKDEVGDTKELQRLIHEQSLLPETTTQSSPNPLPLEQATSTMPGRFMEEEPNVMLRRSNRMWRPPK